MPAAAKAADFDPKHAIVRAWTINDEITRYLLDHVDATIWDADPPDRKGRTIGGIFAHIHNVRGMWLKAAGAADVPEKLEPRTCTRDEARAALKASGSACRELLARSLDEGGRVKGFKPDAASFLGYLIAHDSHHRGQISMLARQLGKPLAKEAMFGMWEWGRFAR